MKSVLETVGTIVSIATLLVVLLMTFVFTGSYDYDPSSEKVLAQLTRYAEATGTEDAHKASIEKLEAQVELDSQPKAQAMKAIDNTSHFGRTWGGPIAGVICAICAIAWFWEGIVYNLNWIV